MPREADPAQSATQIAEWLRSDEAEAIIGQAVNSGESVGLALSRAVEPMETERGDALIDCVTDIEVVAQEQGRASESWLYAMAAKLRVIGGA